MKTTGVAQTGLASTFITKLDMPDIPRNPRKGRLSLDKPLEDDDDKGAEGKPKPKQDMSKVKCFICSKKGHIAPNCPENDMDEEPEENKKQVATWKDENEDKDNVEANLYVTYEVYNSVHSSQRFNQYEILLDNQVDVSVVHPCLLRDEQLADSPIMVNGIGGKQLKVKNTGFLEEFFRVHASKYAKPSVLRLSDVEDLYKVSYVPGQAFIVHLPSGDLEFKRTGKLYVANFQQLLYVDV